MNFPVLSRIAAIALLAIAASCAQPQRKVSAPPPEPQGPVSPIQLPDDPAFRITLRGDPFSATAFTEEEVGVIPFGLWLNAIPLKESQHGHEFAVSLEGCSGYGCILHMADPKRLIVAKRGISGSVRFALYDEGWHPGGAAALSEAGWAAVPMSSTSGKRELWVIKENGRMHGRYPHSVRTATIARWDGESGVFLLHGSGISLSAERIDLKTGNVESATPMAPWWDSCAEGEEPIGTGLAGEVPELLAGLTGLPVFRRGEQSPGLIELTEAVRPMTTAGLAAPVRVAIDCLGRINVVTGFSGETWLMRFGPDGELLRASRTPGNMTGDAAAIRLDRRGRFYYLVTDMQEDMRTPSRLRLMRLK